MARNGQLLMIFLVSLLPAVLGLVTGGQDPPQVRMSFVQNEFVIRVPVRPTTEMLRFEWEEARGPRCIASAQLRGAVISGSEHVDLVMGGNRRFRANFGRDCPALDFYEGFYVNSPNQMICAGRDTIRSRMGGSCSIKSFSQLVPIRKLRVP